MMQETGVVPTGDFTAWAIPNGTRAEVRDPRGKVVQRFTGEMAWSDAVRAAGDKNSESNSGK